MPNIWNALTEWKFIFTFDKVDLFLLYKCIHTPDHTPYLADIDLFRELSKDWNSGGDSPDLIHFIPFKYSLKFAFLQYELYFNVNENNIINKPNDLEENSK
jgi:hypothetical protein